jgi:hypothetical protein
MSNYVKDADLLMLGLGRTVQRAAANLPQTATGNLFAVTGGRVVVTSIVGQVTTVIQAQANAVKLRATPTVGAVNDMSGTVDINAAAVGSLLAATGLAGDALVLSTGGAVSMGRNPILVAVGNIGLNTAASSTGQIKWTLTYIAYDIGAAVAAV